MTGPNPIAGHNGRTQRTDQWAANGERGRQGTATHHDYREAMGHGNVKTITVTGLNESHTHPWELQTQTLMLGTYTLRSNPI